MHNALESLPWVRQVQIDLPRNQAVVTVLADRYDPRALMQVLAQAGYRGQVLQGPPQNVQLSLNR